MKNSWVIEQPDFIYRLYTSSAPDKFTAFELRFNICTQYGISKLRDKG